jgi:N-acetyl-gamma-glutamyl-phosphate reductase
MALHNYSKRAAIVGVTGFTGQELDGMLRHHPEIRVSGRFASKADSRTGAEAFSLEALRAASPDVVVLATEHDLSHELVPQLLKEGYRVLDMSGAFRLPESRLYPDWYGFEHHAPGLLKESVYGLPEFYAEKIKAARLVANPGCYATAAILPLRPLYKAGAIDSSVPVVVDGKSGVSGAGRHPKPETHFCEVNENLKAYGVLRHRHTPEMISQMPGASLDRFVFTPHLIPITRGILCTIVLRVASQKSVPAILNEAYAQTAFVEVLESPAMPDIHSVVRTNQCRIGVASSGANTVIVSAIDNLVKGAAGQALQNLNLMLGCDESAGISR